MKRLVSSFTVSIFFVSLFAFYAKGLVGCDLSGECAVVMCVQTGEVLFSKNADMRHSMASTTKIMTALLAIEQHTPERVVTADKESITVEGTSMGLKEGDKVTLRGLVYGMLLLSGNDSANLTAKAISGSAESFAELMNKRAVEIGMKNTHFVTPSGLDDDEHYSTAYDMALLGCEAVKNPLFLEVCSKKKAVVSWGNPPCERTFYNHNKMLSIYEGALGVKTGFTKKSGRCLVSCAERNGVMLVAVTLNAPGDWEDHRLLLDYGFSAVQSSVADSENLSIPVTGGLKASVQAKSEKTKVCASDYTKIIYCKKFLYAPVKKGTVAGEVVYFYKGRKISSSPLTVCEDVQAIPAEETDNKKENIFERIKHFFRRNKND